MPSYGRLGVVCLLSFLSLSSSPANAAPAEEPSITLNQCYEWARARSEELKIRGEDVRQSKARGRAALGSALPRVEWGLTDTWQDPGGVDELERKGFSGFVEKDQVESKFSVKQPLFSGLRELSAVSGFKRENARDALRLQRAGRELFEKTAEAFYAVLGHETDWENTHAALALDEDRVKEMRYFLRLGKARKREVFTAEAHAAALKALLLQIEARVLSAREELSFLTGRDLPSVKLLDEIPSPPLFD